MPQTDPWAAFPTVDAAPPPVALPAAFPGVIPGRPKPPAIPAGYESDGAGGVRPIRGGPADPSVDVTKPPQGYRADGHGGFEAIPGGPADPSAGSLSEAQGKASGLLHRGIEANNQFEALNVGPRSYVGQKVADTAPDFKNLTDDATRQKAVAFQRDFISAILRVESGAAVSQSEFNNYAHLYFPQPGDTPDTLAAKAVERRHALEALQLQAGPGGKNLTIPQVAQPAANADQGKPWTAQMAAAKWGTGVLDDKGNPLGPDGGAGYDAKGNSLGFFGETTDTSPAAAPAQQPSPFVASMGDIAQGAGDLVGIVGNPLNATINAATGTNLSTDLGETLRTDMLGIPHGNKTMETINRFGTSALLGSMTARAAAAATNPGVIQNALSIMGKTPIRDTFAGMGAGAGGALGKATGIPGGEVAGNVVGALAGYGGASGVNALASRGGTVPNALALAAERQGVDLLPADAGGPVAKAMTTGTKASPLSVAPVVSAAQHQQGQMAAAVGRAAETQGGVTTTDRAGQSLRAAAQTYSKDTSERGGRMYDKAFALAKGITIIPKRALEALDAQIARVKENPAAPASSLEELTTLRSKIADGVSIQGLRDARTELSQGTYNGKLRSSADRQRYKDMLDGIASDIHDGLNDAGKKDAAALFKRADTFWQARVEHIDEVLQPILGNNGTKSGEDIVKSVEAMARGGQGGNARLSRLLANMPEKEAGQVRATIIDRIGKASPGAQTAEGDAFSASTFLTNWNKMTPQGKASLFVDSGLRSNLNDIAKLAEGMKASQAMANHSNTAIGVGANIGIQGPLTLIHPVGALLFGGAQYLTGKLMASPAIARLLARTAKMPPEAAARTLGQQLGVIAAREPLIANDAHGLQQYLSQAFAQSPTRAAAAGQQEQNGGQPPPQ